MKRTGKIFASLSVLIFSLTLLPFDVSAKGGGGFSGGGSRSFSSPSRSYSSPSRSFSSPSRSYSSPSPSPPRPSSPSGGSFWSWGGTQKPSASPKQSAPSPRSDYDSGASRAMKEQQSKKAFEQANKPSASKASKNEYRDRTVRDLKSDLNHERWQNRELRKDRYYGTYYGRPSPFSQTYYNDPFGNVWFWLWLMDRPRERDTWIYHHQNEIDPARMSELRQKDADLDRRLSDLERQGMKRDPSYVPPDLAQDKDLVYDDATVKEAYDEINKSSFPWMWIGLAILGICAAAAAFKWRVIRA